MERPDFFELKNGSRAKLPFTDQEYKNRLNKIRKAMSKKKIDMVILTSMHNIAYIQVLFIFLLVDHMVA